MVNLHNIVRRAISSINPDQEIIIKKFVGQQHSAGGLVEPIYTKTIAIAQVQPVASQEIQFIHNYVSSSTYKNFYINGNWEGLDRTTSTGGDLIVYNGDEWYIDAAPESWNATAGWTKVRGVRQLREIAEYE